MSIITLITDFGLKDHFAGILKGKIFTILPETNIVDITHAIDKFNILEACYILSVSYSQFPKGTVHIVCVDASRNTDTEHIVMCFDGHYFVGADNGIFGELITNLPAEKLIQISNHNTLKNGSNDFDIFAKVATHLAKGEDILLIGTPISEIKKINVLVPIVEHNSKNIKGNVIYIDDFGNCVTNISKPFIENIAKGRNFVIRFSSHTIKNVKNNYSDFKNNTSAALKALAGNEIAVFNENGFLEIAIYRSNPNRTGSANSLLGLKIQDVVIVEFVE